MRITSSLFIVVLLLACANPAPLTSAEEAQLRDMYMSDEVPPSPTNRWADDLEVADWGRALFFDERMSSDGMVSCASCHDPEQGWSDSRRVSTGVEEQEGERHSMPAHSVSFQRYFFWDGRSATLWAQALEAMGSDVEMNFKPTDLFHFIRTEYRADYERLFGESFPEGEPPLALGPGIDGWNALDAELRDAVLVVATRVGKALEAYQRRLHCNDTEFDRWTQGELELSGAARRGAAVFIRQGCIGCHSGPAFSDALFHNIGVGSDNPPDTGREEGIEKLWAENFASNGPYSDDPEYGQSLLDAADAEPVTRGAFRTPTLRGVSQREFFGHRGHKRGLSSFMDGVYDNPRLRHGAVGELDPLMRGVNLDNFGAMRAFLRTLDCRPMNPRWSRP